MGTNVPNRYAPARRRRLLSGEPLDPNAPLITDQPDQVCYNNGLHTYTVVATSGDASPLTYQWQELVGTWTDIVGATSATYAPVLTYPEKDLVQIRCIVTNDTSSVTSSVVRICYTGIIIGIITEDGLDDTVSEDGTTEIIEDRL